MSHPPPNLENLPFRTAKTAVRCIFAWQLISATVLYLLPISTNVVVVVVYFVLSRLLQLAFSANLGLLCMPHPGMGPLV